MFVQILSASFILLIKSTTQHYGGYLDDCILSKMCNHTFIATCGQDEEHSNYRLFLDQCDMYEYNCDNGQSYIEVEVNRCGDNCTRKDDNQIVTTPISFVSPPLTKPVSSTTEMKNIPTQPIEATKTTATTGTVKTSMTTLQASPTTIHENAIITTRETTTKTLTEFTEKTVDKSEILTSFTKITTKHLLKEETKNKSSLTSKNISQTINITRTDETGRPNSTYSSLHANITLTSVDFENIPTSVEASTPITNSENVPNELENTIPKDTTHPTKSDTTHMTCNSKSCNLPSTWETTGVGETRDFVQILRERFGDRLKILRHTTHFPEKPGKSIRRGDPFVRGRLKERLYIRPNYIII